MKPTCLAILTASRFLGMLLALAVASPGFAADNSAEDFEKHIKPFLTQHCVECHGPKEQNAGLDFSKFPDTKSVLRARKEWRKVLTQIETGEMPPAEKPKPAAALRDTTVKQIHGVLEHVDCKSPDFRNPGPTLIHRLNRSEYQRTVRDLTGIDFDVTAAVGLPDDGVTHGYDNVANALTIPPTLMEKYFAAADKVVEKLLVPGPVQDRLFVVKAEGKVSQRDATWQNIQKLARRAYRRRVSNPEVDRLYKFYELTVGRGESHQKAFGMVVKAVLLSPQFLFRIEQNQGALDSKHVYRVSNHEFAVRLSYFLWSSMPDDELLTVAESNKLMDAAVLEGQVKRMLADPKARALTENFAAQWLGLRKLADARPSAEYFPTFTPQVRQAMYDETASFFDKLREENRSILELLDSDYTYLNEDLAKHYNIAGVTGPEMRRVALKPADHRGGLLGMGSMLALTSHTSRTSPTLRGKWILESVFGTPPPPPPANVGQLDEATEPGKEAKTFREKMALHARQASCAGCHKRVDPLGFGLENYDAVGRWRDTIGEKPVDNAGTLPGGDKFAGAAELKQVIVKRKDDFVHNLAEQLLGYALGRELEYYDECTVREVTDALVRSEYRFDAVVLGIVRSYPFQHRKNLDAAE